MSKNDSIVIYRMKTQEEIKRAINLIVQQLEHHGRALTNNGSASRILSRYLVEPIRKEQVYFTRTKDRKSLIALPPTIKLVRVSDNKIKLVIEKEFENY